MPYLGIVIFHNGLDVYFSLGLPYGSLTICLVFTSREDSPLYINSN